MTICVSTVFSQCIPCDQGGVCTGTTTSATRTTVTTATGTGTRTTTPVTSSTPPPTAGKLRFAGVNIAGFDFGSQTDGSAVIGSAWPPLTQFFGQDGAGQMNHFVKDDGFNLFRLPVGWQFLLNSTTNAGGPLNAANLAEYDALVQACLASGSGVFCIIDIHNYARFQGQIIGQGGPTNAQFAATWAALAAKYKAESRIMFGIVNEPHDIPNVVTWAATVQTVVTAIRNAGATSQIILLPGNNWQAASSLFNDGSGDALLKVTNPDGSTTNLIFDVHKYLDANNSGVGPDCAQNNIDTAWAPLAQWLRANKRQALNTETGGGNTANCLKFMCQQIAYQAQNSDVYLGYAGWGAGNFFVNLNPGYDLSETPQFNATTGKWTDVAIVSKCMAPVAGAQNGNTG
ncbi:Glycoside hydrolase family 5 protein [Mycena kentingensis (nom. inval.)]|nr:Glycoside hydrolase family 5 protein [Mycena kentingensis (nom. inval.)]